MPEGALQVICGSVGDLLDHVDCQDVVTFTGSAATGRRLRAHPRLIEQSVRFTMEADSLNSAILAPDAAPGGEEFDLFVREVAREMTVKAGQKCTAIRRAMVPRAHVDAAIEALSARLAKTTLGDPRAEGVRMGPLASLAQREEVRETVAKLRAEAELAVGDPDSVTLAAGDAEAGAFVAPVALYCDQPMRAEAVHAMEAFGPVATVMPYDGFEEAAALARKGLGSLVASVFTNDPATAREAAAALGPWHGRLLIANRTSANPPPGTARPCRCWSMAGLAGPAAARSSAGCAASNTTCSARPSRARRTC